MMVDDEEEILHAQTLTLNMAGYDNILAINDSRKALDVLADNTVEVILLDLAMPNVSGEALLNAVKENYPYIPVIVITATDYVETAVSCMKAGALDYMVKPIEKNRLVSGIQNAIELRSLQRRYEGLKKHLTQDVLEQPEVFSSIITQNRKMRGIFQYLETVGKTDLTVLITGETGTGKELIAEAIHRISERDGNFVPVNIAGLDDTMISDTLFGHRKGAFTGAMESRKGLLQEASQGTILIDEIGDLSPSSQVKLLRLLEYGEYYPLGSDVRRMNTSRIILATQQSSEDLLRSGSFRKDLYYRIATHNVHLPPLRERKEDIPLLVHHFIELASKDLDREISHIPPELHTLLSCYHFPGNIRELRSMVWDAVSKQRTPVLSLDSFRESIGKSVSCADFEELRGEVRFGDRLPTLSQIQTVLIEEALSRSRGNISVAADILGISRQALSKRLKR